MYLMNDKIDELSDKQLEILRAQVSTNEKRCDLLENHVVLFKNHQADCEQIDDYKLAENFYELLNDFFEEQHKRIEQELEQELLNEFYKFVKTQDFDDSMFVQLKKNTRTVKLLDEFIESFKDFLIFEDYLVLFLNDDYNDVRHIDLVITRAIDNVPVENQHLIPSITDMKNRYLYVGCIGLCIQSKISHIIKNIYEIVQDDILGKIYNEVIPFKKPFMFGGRTSSDREGNGTKCGQITKFNIVGIIIKNYSYLFR